MADDAGRRRDGSRGLVSAPFEATGAERALRRLRDFYDPTEQELAFFASLLNPEVPLRRREVLRRQGDEVRDLFMLQSGWMISAIELADGSRQIVKVHLPGDLLGSPSLAREVAVDTLQAVTDCTVRQMPIGRLTQVFTRAPRIAGTMFLSALQERSDLMDRLASIGQTSALCRLCAFIVSICDRLGEGTGADGCSFQMPLSQDQLADLIGVTSVHINRTVKELDATGLVERSGRHYHVPDLEALRIRSALPRRSRARAPSWLLRIAD